MKFKVVIWIGSLLFISISAGAQFFVPGQEPVSYRFNYIDTENFRIIYPGQHDSLAHKTANLLEYSHGYALKTLKYQISDRKKVILHPHSMRSNGFVAVAPKRMELITTAPWDNENSLWLNHLVLHELRHVGHTGKINTGMTKWGHYLLGDFSTGIAGAYLPFWFLEGDAIITETALTNGGRGRDPYFFKDWKALITNNRQYEFDKAYFGSFKDHVPNYYQLGYLMASYARLKYGTYFWNDVLRHVGKNPYQIAPFYFALKKYGNITKPELYSESMEFWSKKWNNSDHNFPESTTVIKATDDHISYLSPVNDQRDGIFALKKSKSINTTLIHVDSTGKEKNILSIDRILGNHISSYHHYLMWIELVPDIRYEYRNFSDIFIYDQNTGETERLTRKQRYLWADFDSHSGKIAAIGISKENKYFLDIFDMKNQNEGNRVYIPDNAYPQFASWYHKGVLLTLNNGTRKSIFRYTPQKEQFKKIYTAPENSDIRYPVFAKKRIFFTASFEHSHGIYSTNENGNDIKLHWPARYSVDNYVVHNDSLIFAEYKHHGWKIAKTPVSAHYPLKKTALAEHEIARQLYNQENWKLKQDSIPDSTYTVKKYGPLKNLIHIHSWAPVYVDYQNPFPIEESVKPGAMLFTQNLTGTLYGDISYYYDQGHYFTSSLTLKSLGPIISYRMLTGQKPTHIAGSSLIVDDLPADDPRTNHIFNVSYPMNFSRHSVVTRLNPSVRLKLSKKYHYLDPFNRIKSLLHSRYQLSFYHYQRMVPRDINPRLGLVFQSWINHVPALKKYSSTSQHLLTRIYLPGLFRHHSIKTDAYYGYEKKDDVSINSFYLTLRDFGQIRSKDITSVFTLKTDYSLPLFYPDFNISRLLYFKRVYSSLYADISRINKEWYDAWGIELITDYHAARVVFPIKTGIGISYIPHLKKTFTRLIFDLNIL